VLKNTFGSGGLIYNQTYVFISNAVIPSIIELADVWGLYRRYQQWSETQKGEKCVLTQLQLNKYSLKYI